MIKFTQPCSCKNFIACLECFSLYAPIHSVVIRDTVIEGLTFQDQTRLTDLLAYFILKDKQSPPIELVERWLGIWSNDVDYEKSGVPKAI